MTIVYILLVNPKCCLFNNGLYWSLWLTDFGFVWIFLSVGFTGDTWNIQYIFIYSYKPVIGGDRELLIANHFVCVSNFTTIQTTWYANLNTQNRYTNFICLCIHFTFKIILHVSIFSQKKKKRRQNVRAFAQYVSLYFTFENRKITHLRKIHFPLIF